MTLSCGVLAYIKAFRQRADIDSVCHSFGVPEEKDISVVFDVLHAVAGSKVAIKDTFRLSKSI